MPTTTPASPRGLRLSSAERRRQLAEAALQLLAEQGASGLTVRALAGRVGLRDGSIFRHFSSKEAIVDAAIERFEGFLAEDLPPEGGAPLDRLRAFFVKRLGKLRAHPEVLALALSDRLEEAAGEAGAARMRAALRHQRAFVASCVREAQAGGALDPRVEPQVLTWMVMGSMRGAARADGLAPDEVFRQVEIALGGANGRRR